MLLTIIRDHGYQVTEGQGYFAIVQEMMTCAGSPDQGLQEDLIYDILVRWIQAGRRLPLDPLFIIA